MKAFQITAPGRTVTREIDPPEPGRDEVLIRMGVVGLCGSDLNTFRGKNPLVSYPRVPGHEVGAFIEAAGSGASCKPGSAVTVLPYHPCNACTACRAGRPNACRFNETLGVQRDGLCVPFARVHQEKVMHFEGLEPGELALVEPLAVGIHAVRRAGVSPSDSVLVLGCGAVGLGAVAGAAHLGAKQVIAVDIDPTKLKTAEQSGATSLLHSEQEDLHEAVQAFTSGEGVHVAIEAVGLPETFRAAVDEAAFSGRVVYIGYAGAPVSYETKRFVQKELDILGSRNALPRDFETAAEILQQGKFPVVDAVTRTVPFDEAGDALEQWADDPRAVTKIHLAF